MSDSFSGKAKSSEPSVVMCSQGLAAARARLVSVQLRPTRQRLTIAWLLLGSAHRHVDANTLYAELLDRNIRVSLATVYNALREFERVGLIRRIAVAGERAWYDTDIGDHRHFFVHDEDRVEDIPAEFVKASAADLPPPPQGYRIARVDIVIHLERDDDN